MSRLPPGPDLPEPNAPMTLPPEVLDKILDSARTRRHGRTTDPDRMRFGGYLVDRAQPTTPLLFGLDPQGQPPAMDERRCPLWI
jgi:hypothetical protein